MLIDHLKIAIYAVLMSRVRQPVIRSLTGSRFIAAILVVCFHFIVVTPTWLNSIFRNGYLGVPFFFVLSGFILTYNYSSSPEQTFSVRSFWAARFARIYPIYLLALILYLPFFFRELRIELPQIGGRFAADAAIIIFFNVTLIQAFVPLKPLIVLLNVAGWTLCVEAVFYLVFPLVARPIARLRLIDAFGAVALNILLLGLFAHFLLPALPVKAQFLGMSNGFLWQDQPILWLPTFLTGAAVARIYMELRGNQYIARHSGNCVLLLSVLCFFGLAKNVPEQLGLYQPAVTTAFFAAMVFFLAFDQGFIAAALSISAVMALGEASYALYILQMPLWGYFEQFYSKVLHAGDPLSVRFYVSLIVVLCGASIVANKYFETPIRKAIRSFLKTRQSAVLAGRDAVVQPS